MSDTPIHERPDLVALRTAFGDLDLSPRRLRESDACNQWYIAVPADALDRVARFLHDDDACRYDQITDLTCVDYLEFPDATDRYGVVYNLVSVTHNRRLFLKILLNDPDPTVTSVTGIWPGADWLEREVYDLFGITFTGHPDLRRLMTWEGFGAHPLRKDYPLRGRGERENYERVTRDSA